MERRYCSCRRVRFPQASLKLSHSRDVWRPPDPRSSRPGTCYVVTTECPPMGPPRQERGRWRLATRREPPRCGVEAPPLRPARRRPRRADGAGQPLRLAAGSGDHSPGGRRPMLRAAPGLEVRDSATGHMTSPVILTEGVARLRHDIEQHLPDGAAQAEHDASTFFATDLPALSAWRFSGQDARRITQPVLYLGGTASGPWRFTSSSLAGCRRRRL